MMKFHRTMILVPLVCLGLCSYSDRAYAEETVSNNNVSYESVSEDSISVSENEIPEEEIPGEKSPEEESTGEEKPGEDPKEDPQEEKTKEEKPKDEKPKEEAPKDETPKEEIPEVDTGKIEIKPDSVLYDYRAAVIKIFVESTGSDIKRAEVCNSKAGIRKILFEAKAEMTDRALVLHLRTRSNGKYIFRAYDTKGNIASCEVIADRIESRSFSDYREKAKENSSRSPSVFRKEADLTSPCIYGGQLKVQEAAPLSGREYIVGSGVDKKDEKDERDPDTDKYGQWSLLKEREKKSDARIWYEPYTVKTENVIPENETNDMPDLSDYGVKLFRTAVISPSDAFSRRTDDSSVKEADISIMERSYEDSRGCDDPVLWITIILFIIMILAAVLIVYMKAVRSKKYKG